jgi:hypothetical protein
MPTPRHLYVLVLAFLLGAPGFGYIWIMAFSLAPLAGYVQTTFFLLLPNCLFTLQYIVLEFSSVLICGSFMTKFIDKCEASSQSMSSLDESKHCVATYNSLRPRVGHILLLTTTKYALYATINPFMAYLAYAFGSYSDAAVFALMSGMAVLSLVYVCVLSEECSEALRLLLVPLR